jgi:dihydroorotate dehydrogenase electron transfer subunit
MTTQADAEVLSVRRDGAYYHLSFAAPGIADGFRPGHFVAIAVDDAHILRRAFSIRSASTKAGGALQIIVSPKGPGTQWLVRRRPGDIINVIAPLGKPFRLPTEPVPCVLVGGGYGVAPLFELASQLRARGCAVDIIVGAGDAARLYGVVEARRVSDAVHVTTDDGSSGQRGRVTDPLAAILEKGQHPAVYACGPMGMLHAVADVSARFGATAQCAVEESMACGVGVCMTCVLPVIGDDGVTRMVRSCTEGPVFFGDRVRWADVGTVPVGTLGAPEPRDD